MSRSLKLTVAALAAVCLLLLAGAFPLLGAEAVYRGGAMLLLALAVAGLSLWGAWRLSAGARARLVFGMIALFFAGAGVAVLWQFGSMGIRMAQTGGPLWMGAIAMFCTSLVGIVFTGVFGYLCWKTLHTANLWLAGAHVSLALLLAGAFADFLWEQRIPAVLPADGTTALEQVTTEDGTTIPLGFKVVINDFRVTHYEATSYSLYTMADGHPADSRELTVKDGELWLGEEHWPIAALKTAPGMKAPFLLIEGEEPRIILQDAPAVKDYAADCTIHTDHKGRPETRHETLRVNEPLECKGWLLYLTNYTQTPRGTHVQLLVRRAPGRIPALAGIVGIIACIGVWAWKRRTPEC